MSEQIENVVIIGSGPAGYTAAIYAARANLKPVLFEGLQAGGVPGGQLMTTTEVENFPGFPEGITGPQLMERMKAQAQRWGTECYTEDVTKVDLTQRPFTVRSDEREIKTHSIIIATGATAKRLGLPSEKIYWNNGISACAICDGASPLFSQQDLVVIGGGDSAAEDVQDHEYRQAISAAGTGCMAALSAERWLSEHNLITEYSQVSSSQTPPKSTAENSIAMETEATFEINATRYRGGYALRRLFHESDRLLVVKYVSPTCGPCKILTPILDKVVDEYESQIHFVEIDIVAEPEIAQMGQVIGTPTIQFFRDRQLLQEVKGVKQKSEYRQIIENNLAASIR